MHTTQQFMKDLSPSPLKAIEQLTTRMLKFDCNKTNEQRLNAYVKYLDFFDAFIGFLEVHQFNMKIPVLGLNKLRNINRIVEFFQDVQTNIEKVKSGEDTSISSESVNLESIMLRDLLVSDHEQIQKKINLIREQIAKSQDFQEDYKRRLLIKVEKLQQELHRDESFTKRVGNRIGSFFAQDVNV